MNKTAICEAMYALPEGAIERRHKSFVPPFACLVSGAALLILNNLFAVELSVNFRSALVFLGGSALIVGLVMALVLLFDRSGVPYFKAGNCYLHYDELRYEHRFGDVVRQYVETGDLSKLFDMRQTQVPAVTVAIYRAPDNRFVAMQAFEYADLEYRPLTDLRIFNQQI